MISPYIKRLRDQIGSELLMVPSVAILVHDNDGRLLLQKKANGEGWSLPAGAIEPGETPEDAARRELFEETGRMAGVLRLSFAMGGRSFRYRYPNGDEVEYTVLVYRCDRAEVRRPPPDPETVRLAFFNRSEMPPLALPYPMELLFPDLAQ